MADDRDSLLREVDEELRRDQMQKFWDRYSGLIMGAAALIVAGVGGYKFMESRRIAAAEAAGAELVAAAELSKDKKNDEATKAYEKIIAGGGSYASLAQLHLAGEEARAGKTAEAVTRFEAISKSAGDDLLKSFAQLQAANLRSGEADFTEMQNRLNPLVGDSSAFKTSARELLGLAAFKASKFDEARKYLEPLLIDPEASAAIQERIKIVMAQMPSPAPAPAAAPAPSAPAAPAVAAPEPEKK